MKFIRNALFVLGLVVVGGAFYWYQVNPTILELVNNALPRADRAAHTYRAIQLTEKNLKELESIDLAFRFDRESINIIEDKIKEDLSSDEIASEGIRIDSVAIDFGNQFIAADVNARIERSDITIELKLAADLAIGAVESDIVLYPTFRPVVVNSVESKDKQIASDLLVRTAIAAINYSLPILNRIYHKEAKLPRIPLKFGPIIKQKSLTELSSDDVQYQERSIEYSPAITNAAFLITKEAVYGIAKVNNKKENHEQENTLEPPIKDAGQINFSQAELDLAYTSLKNSIIERIASAADLNINELAKGSWIGVIKGYLSNTLNKELILNDPVCGTAILKGPDDDPNDKNPLYFDQKFYFTEEPEGTECDKYREECKYLNLCRDKNVCSRKISKTVMKPFDVTHYKEICTKTESVCTGTKKVCSGWGVAILGPAACLSHKTVCISTKEVCKATKKVVDRVETVMRKVTEEVVEPVMSPVCEGFRQASKLSEDFCTVASNLEDAFCHSLNSTYEQFGHAWCESQMALKKLLSKNPAGQLTVTLASKGSLKACVNKLGLSPNFDSADFVVEGSGSANLDAKIKFDPHLIGRLACTYGWTSDFDAIATTKLEPRNIPTKIEAIREDESLKITMTTEQQQIHVSLDRSPFSLLFENRPDLILSCKTLIDAGVGWFVYDTVINEKLKGINPIISGKDYPFDIKPQTFGFKIKPITLLETEESGGLKLYPYFEGNMLRFSSQNL